MDTNGRRLDTRAIHAGEPSPRHAGAVAMPIYQSATFEANDDDLSYHDIRYARLSNTPNHIALHEKLASLENAEAALVAASGMAAISTAILSVVSSGDHLLVHKVLYGGTHDFVVKDLPALGVTHDVIDATKPETWKAKLRPNTKAIYVETMTNPLLEVADHSAVVAFARQHGLISLIDNTFASPVNYRPPEHGYDLSLHSATKYLNGHSDLIAGAVIGSRKLVEKIRVKMNHLGGSLDPHACFLLHRGIKTLAVRVRFQNESALKLARFLSQHPAVSQVMYPGLEDHPQHARARELFDGFGGMVSIELRGGLEAAKRMLKKVRLAINAPSLGGVDSLICRPAAMSHAGLTRQERAASGISDSLIRISVGIEATEDLIDDFNSALA
jgi:cystathionine beta-lyase/cystathionine gamma-synthase